MGTLGVIMRGVAVAAVLALCAFVSASDGDGIAGLTPSSGQTGQLKENQKFLFGATETKCARHVICKACTEDISCGWCATSGCAMMATCWAQERRTVACG